MWLKALKERKVVKGLNFRAVAISLVGIVAVVGLSLGLWSSPAIAGAT